MSIYIYRIEHSFTQRLQVAKEKLLAKYKDHILPGPLNGIVVLGFCYYVSGPLALQNLVTQGALVIKIEKQPIGDPSRYVFSPDMYNALSHNQLSIALDYSKTHDRQMLLSLLKIADVIVDNRSVKAKKNDPILQYHLNSLDKSSPQVYCSINGYPNEDTHSKTALDASVQAETGLAYSNCFSPSKPLKVGIPILDQVTGLIASQYIISNLYLLSRFPSLPESAKKIIYISVSMAGASMWLQTGQVIRALEGRGEFLRSENKDQFAAPFSYYTTKNGLVSIATVNEQQFERFCINVLNDSDFHTKYPTVQVRLEQQAQFEQDLNEKLQTETKEFWCNLCLKYDIPASPVLTVSEAIKQDYCKEVVSNSSDGKFIVTHGTKNSFFPRSIPAPAPILNQNYEGLAEIITNNPAYIKAAL
jgi:CoA:oxalate CoA-transferase